MHVRKPVEGTSRFVRVLVVQASAAACDPQGRAVSSRRRAFPRLIHHIMLLWSVEDFVVVVCSIQARAQVGAENRFFKPECVLQKCGTMTCIIP